MQVVQAGVATYRGGSRVIGRHSIDKTRRHLTPTSPSCLACRSAKRRDRTGEHARASQEFLSSCSLLPPASTSGEALSALPAQPASNYLFLGLTLQVKNALSFRLLVLAW